MAAFNDMAQRKNEMSDRLAAHGVTNDCRMITAAQTAGTDLWSRALREEPWHEYG
jgi:hypothetical protein